MLAYNQLKALLKEAAFKEESAFRSEIYLGLCLLPLSVVLAQSLNHWLVLFIPYLLLLIVELLNSSIEALTDRVGIEYHVLSGRAKDMASAAVTLSLANSSLGLGCGCLRKNSELPLNQTQKKRRLALFSFYLTYYRPAAARSASALSVLSQGNSSRPK